MAEYPGCGWFDQSEAALQSHPYKDISCFFFVSNKLGVTISINHKISNLSSENFYDVRKIDLSLKKTRKRFHFCLLPLLRPV